MTFQPLSRLLSESRPYDTVVAWRDQAPLRFGQLRSAAAAVAAGVAGCGRVALVCQDSFHFAAAFMALAHSGAEIVLPPNHSAATLTALSGAFDRVIDDSFVAMAAGSAPLRAVDAERIPVTFFTSGSTGQPKQITRTLAMLQHEVAALQTAFGPLPRHGRVLATVGHQHLYGLTFKLLWPLSSGRAFDVETHEIWEALVAAQPGGGAIVSSPAHLSRLGGLPPLPDAERPAALFCAGAPLGASAARFACDVFGILPTEIFGSTESGAAATRQQIGGDESWRLLPDVEIRIDPDGLLAFRSPQVAGWVTTGDLARSDSDGLRFLGRTDGVVKIEGKRVSLAAVEAALMALPFVRDAAVMLLAETPVRLAAVVVPSELGWTNLEAMGHFRFGAALARALAPALEPAGRPKRWRFVAALPQRHMGKRDAAALTGLFVKQAA